MVAPAALGSMLPSIVIPFTSLVMPLTEAAAAGLASSSIASSGSFGFDSWENLAASSGEGLTDLAEDLVPEKMKKNDE